MKPGEFTVHHGWHVTSPTRTLIDLAAVCEIRDLETMVESARRRGLTSTQEIACRLDQIGGRGRLGATKLRTLLEFLEGRPAAESILEVRVARLLRAAAVPEPVRQHPVGVFGFNYRLDFAWPDQRVALECDGREFHDFQRDRVRWRRLVAAGWRIVPVTWLDVDTNWHTVVRELCATLSRAY